MLKSYCVRWGERTPAVAQEVYERRVALLRDSPGRYVVPAAKLLERPLVGLVRVAGCAGVGDAGLLGQHGRDEAEGVGGDEVVLDGLLDARHVAGGALASGAAGGMVGVLGDGA